MTDLQQIVQQQLEEMVATGESDGLQCAVYHRGEQVCDAWAGGAITRETLLPIFSCGKGIASTAVHMLVERGALAYDEPVARHWPAFATAGKARITVRQILDHSAGLAMMPEAATSEQVCDWRWMCDWLAAASPHPPPGSARHYHAITFGWLCGELIRRIDGRAFADFVREEITEPLGIDELFFGVPDEQLPRVAEVYRPPADEEAMASVPQDDDAPDERARIAARAIPDYCKPLEDWINTRAIRQACMPASNGIASARALARFYAGLVGDGVGGVRLLGDGTLDEACSYRPLPDESEHRFGLGYILSGPESAPGQAFGHGGYGGSLGVADRRLQLAIGFTTRRMGCSSGELVELIRTRLTD